MNQKGRANEDPTLDFWAYRRIRTPSEAYYLKPTDKDLAKAMTRYTVWLDKQLAGKKGARKIAD